MSDDTEARLRRVRREPPPLRELTLVEREERSPRLLRLTFEGAGLRELIVDEPAASVRLLVPSPGTDELVLPTWNGNEFLLPEGSRPALRTFTPLRVDNEVGRLDIEVVRHPGGAVSTWAETAAPGSAAALSGPGTGFTLPEGTRRLLVLADETAHPAAAQLMTDLPPDVALDVHIEAVADEAVVDLPDRADATTAWHVAEPGAAPGAQLVGVAEALDALPDDTHVWAAGEAASVQAIRTHLFQTLGLDRTRATIRGYWKPARH